MEALQKAHYSQTPLADINESFKAQKMFTSNAGIKDFTPASKYFDPSLYLKTIA